jgi:UDP-N-acetylglucosamine--N-acetylmuramyl-(pentapeptide) pyrophosphoryl-undecaprenol N-acetylglucosamine transferase
MHHRIAITGGGTGGHVYPALSVYEQLLRDPEIEAILYIGAKGHLEERLAADRKVQFVGLRSVGLPRKLSPELLAWPFQTLSAVLEARKVLRLFRPTAVLGTGGYAAAPPLAAAKLMAVPYAVHEPDAHPGKVNRLFAGSASLCSLGMEGATQRMQCGSGKVVVNGNPIADRFLHPPDRREASASLGLNADLCTMLVTGGSQGAQAINDAVLAALPKLLTIEPPLQIVHQVGEKNFAEYKQQVDALSASSLDLARYHIRPYFDDLATVYAATDLAICRAGAMTIAELGVSGTPAIFVPYPYAAQDHQTHNARFVEAKGAAIVIMQQELSAQRLFETVQTLLGDRAKLGSMRAAMKALGKPDAAASLAVQLKQLSTDYQSRTQR